MILQEPVQAAIWHCLNHYDFTNAVFLSERLYAEVKSDDSLFLLATAYYRSGQKDHAYHVLKERTNTSSQCRYLFGVCAYDLEKYAEAEGVLLQKHNKESDNLEDLAHEYGEQASFAFSLLGNIAAKTERKPRAIEAWKKALKLNPFQWSVFENLCKIGDRPNPQSIFQMAAVENLSTCQGLNLNNIESLVISTPHQEKQLTYITPPQPIVFNHNPNCNKLSTPDESPLCGEPLLMSGFLPLSARMKPIRSKIEALNNGSPHPTFGQLFESETYVSTPNVVSQPKLTESNNHQSLAKRMKAQVDNLISRKDPLFQNCKPLFSQSTNVAKTPNIPLSIQPCPNVRRSSRLFSNSYSVKENNKSPNRNKYATPKSPTKKTKQRITKNLNKNYAEMNTKNRLEKEKSETITSKGEKCAINDSIENCLQQAISIQQQSAEGLMILLRALGQVYVDLTNFNCKAAIEGLNLLSPNQFQSSWVYCLLGVAHFELGDYESSIKYFSKVHSKEPHRIQYMDVYSTALWHLQNEVALSALAQDLVNLNRQSPVTWCVSGNCFSLHKEHDTAIKFFQRAVQVDPNFPYAYTLLGHEYITTEELDKATSCFRNAIRLDPRHYNAWFGLGTIYSKQERYLLAEINYSRALSINPHSSVILCHIGIVQNALKQPEKALQTLNAAIANNPKSPLCKFHRGSIYFALGRHAEALKELEELKEIVPKESLVYYLIGKIHKKLGNTDIALMHFSWATDLDPKGASSQIKEAFDPSIGRSSEATETPAFISTSETPQETTPRARNPPGAGLQPEVLNFGNLADDSEDSF